jgi:RNA polymerase sigma factor (sigma-70 family)
VPLLRLASDEKLVAITRRGNPAAFEALVARYQARLLAFCRHMLSTREDAEDVLQEVFAAAYNAMIADQRTINVRPWLYRIARNRSLNHLRRTQALGVDSMDVHVAEHGTTTAEKVHRREDFRLLVADVQTLPETQRTALLLREIDALSYEQIAEAMDTTVPSVKSLLVRARVSLADAAQARAMTCEEVRVELGEVAEGIQQRPSAPVRRHLRQCDRCAAFRKQLRHTNKALAAIFPVGPLLFLKKALLAQLGTTASAGGSAATGAVAGTAASGGATALSAGVSAVATKTAAGLAAAALVTAGAVEVRHAQHPRRLTQASVAAPAAAPPVAPVVVASRPQAVSDPQPEHPAGAAKRDKPKADKPEAPTVTPTPTTTTTTTAAPPVATIFDTTTTSDPPAGTPVEGSDTTAMPPQQSGTTQSGGATAPEEPPTGPQPTPPADGTGTGTAPADPGAQQQPPPAAADPAAAPTPPAG